MSIQAASTSTHDEVMFYDTDAGGVVHNLAYLRMIEFCRTKLAQTIGFDLSKMMETQQFPVVVQTLAEYRKPARLGDHLITHGWIEEWGKARFWCAFEMIRSEDSSRIMTCRQQLAVVQLPQGRPLRLADLQLTPGVCAGS
ncbi:MAG: acyl-CoA thioesterase [Luteolibacter sp.]